MKVKNSNNKVEKTDIEFLVLKNFISVLKKNGMYPLFRSVVGSNTKNVVSSIYNRMPSFAHIIKNQSKENIYREAGNIDSFIKMMKDSFNGGLPEGVNDPSNLQHHIANCVNMLLHVFVERNIRDFHKLESLGGEIFDRTCREVFGGDFEDVLPQPSGDVEQMRMLNQMMIDGNMSKPTPEMIEQIKRMLENSNREHHSIYSNAQPMVNEEDWDFLDDFLGDEDEETDLAEVEDTDFNIGGSLWD
jgi:hypothetical protein